MFKKRKMVKKAASYALCALEDQCRKLQAENDALRAALSRAVDAGVGLENEFAKSRTEKSHEIKVLENEIEARINAGMRGLGEECDEMRKKLYEKMQEIARLEKQRDHAWTTVQLYKEAWEALRWRIWVLLKSTNIDAADVFESDVRYRLADEQSMDPAGIAAGD